MPNRRDSIDVPPPPTRRKAPTLLDLAREAGVSKSTVSRVLNSSPDVSDDAQARTLVAIERLGYQINLAARSLRTARTSQIGLLVPAINNEVFGEIAERMDAVLAVEGVSLAITSSGGEISSELRALDALESRGVDAMVVALADERDARVTARLSRFGPPIVLLDRQVQGVSRDAILTDHRSGIAEAMDHLAGLGHRRIAIAAGTDHNRPGREQFAAYKEAVNRLGLGKSAGLRFRADDYARATGRAAAKQFVAAGATAVLACSPVALIAGALEYFSDQSIRIPSDMSFVVYTDSELASVHVPPLSVVLRPVSEIGRMAARLALTKMGNPSLPPCVESVTTQFLNRASTAPPRVPNR